MKKQKLVALAALMLVFGQVGCSDSKPKPSAGSGTGGGVPVADLGGEDGMPEEDAGDWVETEEPAEPAQDDQVEEPAADQPSVQAPTVKESVAEEAVVAAPNKAPMVALVAPALQAPAAAAPAAMEPAVAEPAVAETAAVEPAAVEPVAAAAAANSSAGTKTGDWNTWGGNGSRNMISKATGVDLSFEAAEDPAEGKNLLWTATLGSQTYGNPIVAEGKVFVGTNNGGEYRPQHKGDRGCILCFNEADGKFLWQLTREKLPEGRVNDWPEQGICSTPVIENGRMYVATNRCELMCVDIEGFYDDENDGPYKDEVDTEKEDADIIWSLDMKDELGVFPHNLATSSPVIHGDLIFLVTSNGVDEAHLEVPSPRAPCFMAVNKNSGEVVWEDNSPALDSKAPAPFDNILHGQWGSPAVGEVNGKLQVFMPGGDGVLYAYDAEGGELLWWFDLNPKESKWELGGRGTRNAIISTPVFVENSVILAVGQDPEHGEGVGHLYRIDATKSGDLSPQVADGDGWKDNDNSGEIWHMGGVDEEGELKYRRTISTFSVADGLVYAPDLSGFLHCIDFKTGEKKWEYDTFAAVWGSPMVVDGHVLMGDEDGEMVILKAGDKLEEVETKLFNSSIYSTPTIANGRMYVSDRSRLYAFKIQ